ncbi:MAG: hypothetical protein IJ228_05590 [Succinivibrio sp.]|nr:hypothetical protein [Succinivibrio sp.]
MAIVFAEIKDYHIEARDDKGKLIVVRGYYNPDDGWVVSAAGDKITATSTKKRLMQVFDEKGYLITTKPL